MKKSIIRKVLLWAAVIGIASMIFMFSNQPLTESFATSDSLIHAVLQRVSASYRAMDAQDQMILVERLRLVVRKLAHFSEFLMLASSVYALLKEYAVQRSGAWAFALSTAYAALDELHQSLSPGRSPMVMDVLIDSCGVLTGVLLTAAVMRLWSRRSAYFGK